MDKILLGIAASTHSEGVKRAIIERVINSASKAPPEELVVAVLDISSRWMTEDESPFLQQMGRQLFHAWAKHNQTIFEEFFNHRFLVRILGLEIQYPDRTVRFVQDGLRMLQNRATAAKIVQMQVVALVKKHTDLSTLVEVSHLLLAFPECLPRGTASGMLCIAAVENVSALQVAPSEATMKANLEGMVHVSVLLHHIWHENMVTVVPSLAAVFNLISTLPSSDGQGPSVALGALVQHVPIEIIATVTKNAASDMSIVDDRMTTALTRMISWLSWPRVQNIDRWIVSFLKNLALVQKFTILIDVTIASVEKVFVKLCFPIVRDSALPVLTHMLLSFQHSPEAFHKIVAHVPELMKRLKTENSPSSQDCTQKIAELVYCLMYQHAGYPDLYEHVLEVLKHIPRPTEKAMKETLKLSAWTSRAPVNSAFSTRFLPRSETGKTGLVNLGNTCYMNSVLQALVMTSGFHEEIMACPVYNDQCVVARLQTAFAFLTHTQRAAYSPKEFLVASRPPWFSPGTQQDCSEFLKYLLDRLDEEEKSIRKFEAQLQRTREKVECMKRKNAKKKEEMEDEGRMIKDKEGEDVRKKITQNQETNRDGCRRLADVETPVSLSLIKDPNIKEEGQKIKNEKGGDFGKGIHERDTEMRRYSRLAKDSWTDMDTYSASLPLSKKAPKEEGQKIRVDEENDDVSKTVLEGQSLQEGCAEVAMELSVDLPETDASSISLALCNLSNQGKPVCSLKLEDESTKTHLMTVNITEIQSCKVSQDTKTKLPDAEAKKAFPEVTTGPSIVEKYFAGKSVTRIRCLSCNSVSSRTETFFDIPLAFPGSDTTSSMRGGESCVNKDDASKSLGLAADRLAQEEIASGSKQWELNGGAAASTSAIKDLVSGPGQSGEGSESPRGSPSSLEELLVHYLTPELLTGDNQYHCEQCRCLRDAEKCIEISKAPKVLMLTLMRFSYDVKTQSRCKILADVRFPKILNMALNHPGRDTTEEKAYREELKVIDEHDLGQDPPCSKRVRQNSENVTCSDDKTKYRFALYGVIVHSGLSSESGHYYCYARHSNVVTDPQTKRKLSNPQSEHDAGDSKKQDTIPDEVEEDLLPDQWFLFNDSRVSFSSYDSFGNVTKRFPKDTAYVLFYRQVPEENLEQSECQTGLETSPVELCEKPLRKKLQEAVKKDNALYLKERELEARTMALRASRGLESFSTNRRNFDDRNDPPSGCGGGGGGMEPPRLVF